METLQATVLTACQTRPRTSWSATTRTKPDACWPSSHHYLSGQALVAKDICNCIEIFLPPDVRGWASPQRLYLGA